MSPPWFWWLIGFCNGVVVLGSTLTALDLRRQKRRLDTKIADLDRKVADEYRRTQQ